MKDSTKRNVKASKRTEIQLTNLNVKESLSGDSEDIFQSAAPGSIVTFNLLEHESNENILFILELVDHPKSNEFEISLSSPIGKNINNTHVGDVIPFDLNYKKFTITILNIEDPLPVQ